MNTTLHALEFPDIPNASPNELGTFMLSNDLSKGPIDRAIFLSHTHWDHIMGFPCFTPMYIAGAQLKVFGPVTFEDDPHR